MRLRLDEGEAGIANRRMVLRHPNGHLAVVGVRAGLVPYAVPVRHAKVPKGQTAAIISQVLAQQTKVFQLRVTLSVGT